MKLLIIDDSLLMRKAVERALTEQFSAVFSAGDGEARLRLFAEHLPDLVTLDISMPKMDGLTCLVEMRKLKSDAKIVIVSSQTDMATAEKAMNKGAAGIVGKPFSTDQILQKVTEVLGASGNAD